MFHYVQYGGWNKLNYFFFHSPRCYCEIMLQVTCRVKKKKKVVVCFRAWLVFIPVKHTTTQLSLSVDKDVLIKLLARATNKNCRIACCKMWRRIRVSMCEWGERQQLNSPFKASCKHPTPTCCRCIFFFLTVPHLVSAQR